MPGCIPTPEESKQLLAGKKPVRIYDFDKFVDEMGKRLDEQVRLQEQVTKNSNSNPAVGDSNTEQESES
jgi:hypothetical protein